MTPCSSWVVYVIKTQYGVDLNISDVWNLNMTNICHLTSIVDLENQGQTYFQMTFIISGWIHAAALISVLILT